MGWSRHDEEARADHYRLSHSTDWRPGDEPPLSVQRKPSTALEVAALVKLVPMDQAVDLIEAFVASEHQRIRLDAVAAGSNC